MPQARLHALQSHSQYRCDVSCFCCWDPLFHTKPCECACQSVNFLKRIQDPLGDACACEDAVRYQGRASREIGIAGWVAKECYMKVKNPEVKNEEVNSERKLRHPKASR